MAHMVRSKQVKILIMPDAGDALLRLGQLKDDSARTEFNAYLALWISIFDAPVYSIINRGRNLTNEHMASNLR